MLEVLNKFKIKRIDIVNFSGLIKSRFSEAIIKMEIYAENKKAKKIVSTIVDHAKCKKSPLFIELFNLDESIRIIGENKDIYCFLNR